MLNIAGQVELSDVQDNAQNVIGNAAHQETEREITEKAITLIENQDDTLPLNPDEIESVHIIMPEYGEGDKAEALKVALNTQGVEQVTGVLISETIEEAEKTSIDSAQTIIVGTAATEPSPVEDNGDSFRTALERLSNHSNSLVFNVLERQKTEEVDDNQFAYNMMKYAMDNQKRVIHLTLRAPYDVVNFDDVSHSAIATYNYYGIDEQGNDLGANVMESVAETILGTLNPNGRLPVQIFEQNEDGSMGDLKHPIGHGLNY